MKKYICFCGNIKSKNDNEIHHITAERVAELYSINKNECFFINKNDNLMEKLTALDANFCKLLIKLSSRNDGDYSIENRLNEISYNKKKLKITIEIDLINPVEKVTNYYANKITDIIKEEIQIKTTKYRNNFYNFDKISRINFKTLDK